MIRCREHLAELDPPLVERVDVPDHALGEDAVLVERDERAEHRAASSRSARIMLVGRLPSITRCGTSPSAVPSARTSCSVLPKASASACAKTFDDQDVVVVADRVERLAEPDEVDGDELRALVDQLVEVCWPLVPGSPQKTGAGLIVDVRALDRDVLAVRLHRELLQVRGEALQVLLVGHDADGLRVEEVAVPDARAAHEHAAGSARAAPSGSARPSRGSPRASP